MIKFTVKPLLIAVGLSLASLSASAHLVSNRTVLNNTDKASITVKFEQPVSGDLYVATMVDGKLLFFTDKGTLTADILPFKINGDFKADLNILNVSALGIPPNHYPLYEVVTVTGKDPLNFTNWVGGLAGLQRLNFNIGMPFSSHNDHDNDGFSDDDADHDGYRDGDHDFDGVNDDCQAPRGRDGKNEHDKDDDDSHKNNNLSCSPTTTTSTPAPAPAVVPTTTPVPTTTIVPTTTPAPTTTPTVTPTPAPVVDTTKGLALYKSMGCAGGGCHTANPAANKNKVLNGKSLASIRSAIASVPNDMGFLSSESDADLQAVADYLKTF